eukprot:1194595-Prorocentrum_minimum.AAC.5
MRTYDLAGCSDEWHTAQGEYSRLTSSLTVPHWPARAANTAHASPLASVASTSAPTFANFVPPHTKHEGRVSFPEEARARSVEGATSGYRAETKRLPHKTERRVAEGKTRRGSETFTADRQQEVERRMAWPLRRWLRRPTLGHTHQQEVERRMAWQN